MKKKNIIKETERKINETIAKIISLSLIMLLLSTQSWSEPKINPIPNLRHGQQNLDVPSFQDMYFRERVGNKIALEREIKIYKKIAKTLDNILKGRDTMNTLIFELTYNKTPANAVIYKTLQKTGYLNKPLITNLTNNSPIDWQLVEIELKDGKKIVKVVINIPVAHMRIEPDGKIYLDKTYYLKLKKIDENAHEWIFNFQINEKNEKGKIK